jgi:methionyl aminopeptidase
MPRARIELKSQGELEAMALSGRIVCEVLDAVEAEVVPGVTTKDLDEIADEVLTSWGATSAFRGYPDETGANPFPGVLCTSINDEVVHGIPSKDRVLRDGDVVSVDFGCVHEGFYGDSARTIAVGVVAPEVARLLEVTKAALHAAIENCCVNNRLHQIGHAVEKTVQPHGYGIVRNFVGHGIGRNLHEEPQVPNYVPHGRKARSGLRLRTGLVLAIEPMVNLGGAETERCDDGWTIRTKDGSISAHFEHTVAITENGPSVLTLRS